MSSLYLHVPFCRSKCRYCSFYSVVATEHLHERYVAALLDELDLLAHHHDPDPLQTVFFGGGTPTVLGGKRLGLLLHHIRDRFGLASGGEVSVEANPETVSARDLSTMQQAGVNRLSFGVQSFAAEDLIHLGRPHTPEQAKRAVIAAQNTGYDNISLDLMYGLVGQTAEAWRANLQTALALGVQHLSLYQLTIEESTPYAAMATKGELSLPDDEEVLAMDAINRELCAAAGMNQYEISNFAVPGYECRHNITYWHNKEYLAVGAGAVSYCRGRRERRVAAVEEYCRAIESGRIPVIEAEELSPEASFREAVIMGLRLTDGVSRKELASRYGMDLTSYYGTTLERLVQLAMVELTSTHLRLTARGRMLANRVMAELV